MSQKHKKKKQEPFASRDARAEGSKDLSGQAELESAAQTPSDTEGPGETMAQDQQSTEQQAMSPEQELQETTEKLQRVAADYQNYQKRAQRQIEQAARFAQEDLVRALLAVLDNFEHTLAQGAEAQKVEAVLEGVRIVYDHLLNILASHGVRQVETIPGHKFDPNMHEAVLHEESSEFAENAIVRELARGYLINDRTLRPAKVSVAKPPAAKNQQQQDEGTENSGG